MEFARQQLSTAADAVYVNIFGTKGQGKTLALREMYSRVIQAGGRGTFIDSICKNGDLAGIAGPRDAVRGIVRSPAGWWARAREALRAEKPFNLVVQPGWDADLNQLWRLVYEVGHQMLAIDEAEGHAAAGMDKNMGRLISRGRNQQVSIVSTVRVPPELTKLLRGVADVTMSFRQESADYAAFIARECFHSDRIAADLLVRLPQFHYLHYRSASGQLSAGSITPPTK